MRSGAVILRANFAGDAAKNNLQGLDGGLRPARGVDWRRLLPFSHVPGCRSCARCPARYASSALFMRTCQPMTRFAPSTRDRQPWQGTAPVRGVALSRMAGLCAKCIMIRPPRAVCVSPSWTVMEGREVGAVFGCGLGGMARELEGWSFRGRTTRPFDKGVLGPVVPRTDAGAAAPSFVPCAWRGRSGIFIRPSCESVAISHDLRHHQGLIRPARACAPLSWRPNRPVGVG